MLALLSLGEPAKDHKQDSELFARIVSLFVLSFALCTTFFVVSLMPLRLGHPLVPRYATTMMPLIYLIITVYLWRTTLQHSRAVKIGLICLIPFYVSASLHRYVDYRELSIFGIAADYRTFGEQLDEHACVRARSKVVLLNQLDLVPEKYRTEKVTRFIDNENPIERAPWFIVNATPGKPCRKPYTIYRLITMRY